MKQKIFLVADAHGITRMTKRSPDLARSEIAIALTVSIPDSAFRSAILTSAVEVADDGIMRPAPEIDLVNPDEAAIEAAMQELCEGGAVEEVEPGRFRLTEWGSAQARRLLRTSPEAQELWAQLEANKDRIAQAMEGESDD